MSGSYKEIATESCAAGDGVDGRERGGSDRGDFNAECTEVAERENCGGELIAHLGWRLFRWA